MASKGSAYQGDTQLFNSLTIAPSGSADYGGAIINNVGAGEQLTDAANLGQVLSYISVGTSTQISTLTGNYENLSTYTYSSINAINSELVTLSGQVSTLTSSIATAGSPSNWAQYPANSTVNIENNNIYSTTNQTFTSGGQIFTVNYNVLSNISTLAGSGGGGPPITWAQYPAMNDVNMAASSLKSTIGITFINTGLTSTATFGFNEYYYLSTNIGSGSGDISTISTTSGSNLSTLSSFVNTVSTTAGSNFSTLSTSVASNTSNLSTLSSFVNTVSTTSGSNFSTLSTSILSNSATISTNATVRKFAAAAEITPGTTDAGLIVSTNISTLGYLNVFQNITSASLILELKLSTLALWPNTEFEVMRFAHYGQPGSQSSVIIYAEDSNYSAGLLADMAAGDTISFIYKGGAPLVNNNRISTTQYYRVTGY